MFDLNIDLSAENPAYKDLRMPSGSETYQVTEPSGTSESSEVVVVGGDDPDSGNSTSILNFDIFTKLRMSTAEVVPDEDENDLDDFLGNHGHQQFHTRQLFPLKGDSGGGGIGGLSCDYEFRAGSSETRWLNLSVSGSGTGSGSLQQSDKKNPPQQQQVRRSRRGPRSRSSQYRGVTFYRRTGRWESHIWDCGKQVYLGGFDTAYAAARAYDRAAIRFRGVEADINFTISDYEEEMKQMNNLTKEEFVHTLRRQSSGFPRGSSRYRAANLQKYGQLEAQTGGYLGNRPYHNGRETITTFYPRNYEMKMPVEAINREIGQNLELNLGISNSAHCTRGNKSIGEGNPYSPLCHPADGRRPMLGSSYWPPSGQAVASSQSAMWPGFSVIHAEREKQVESVGPSRLSKRSGSIHGGANQVVPLFSRAAASSGFSC